MLGSKGVTENDLRSALDAEVLWFNEGVAKALVLELFERTVILYPNHRSAHSIEVQYISESG